MLQELVDKYGFKYELNISDVPHVESRDAVRKYFTEADIHVSVYIDNSGYTVEIYHDDYYESPVTSVEGVIKRIVEFCNFIIERNNIENKSFEALRSLFE